MSAFNTAAYIFAALGLLSAAGKLRRLLVFAYVYAPGLHENKITKYMWPERPYALVTGATDGIGKALAAELYSRGFNVVIHGRNPDKLAKVRTEILAGSTAAGDVKTWCEDASTGRWDPKALLALTEGLDLTVVALVNGGTSVYSVPIDGQSEDDVHHVMSLNFFFSVFVIRTLLPSLRATAARGPVSLFGLGSLAALVTPPHMAIYAASKDALESVLRSVAADERYAKRGRNLNVKYIQVGNVNSAANKAPPDFQTPTSAAFAKDILRRIDAPWRWAAANAVHAISAWGVTLMGERRAEALSAQLMEKQWGEALTGKKTD